MRCVGNYQHDNAAAAVRKFLGVPGMSNLINFKPAAYARYIRSDIMGP